MFQVRQAQGDMGAAEDDTQWHDEHFMLSYIFFLCVCVCHEATCSLYFSEGFSWSRGSWQQGRGVAQS